MGFIAPFIPLVIGVAQAAFSLISANEEKKEASRRRDLEQRRIANEAAARRLRQAQEEARAKRITRSRRASLLNNAAGNGVVFTSSTTGSLQGLSSSLGRELDFSGQAEGLAREGDAISRAQVELDFQGANRSIRSGLFTGVTSGLGTALGADFGEIGDILGTNGGGGNDVKPNIFHGTI